MFEQLDGRVTVHIAGIGGCIRMSGVAGVYAIAYQLDARNPYYPNLGIQAADLEFRMPFATWLDNGCGTGPNIVAFIWLV